MNFFGSSGCNLESRVSICTRNAQFTTPAAPGYYLAIVSHDGIPLYNFFRYSEYIYNSIPKISESIWWIEKNTKIEFSFYVQIQTRWAP